MGGCNEFGNVWPAAAGRDRKAGKVAMLNQSNEPPDVRVRVVHSGPSDIAMYRASIDA